MQRQWKPFIQIIYSYDPRHSPYYFRFEFLRKKLSQFFRRREGNGRKTQNCAKICVDAWYLKIFAHFYKDILPLYLKFIINYVLHFFSGCFWCCCCCCSFAFKSILHVHCTYSFQWIFNFLLVEIWITHKLNVWCENYRAPFIQKTHTHSKQEQKKRERETCSWSPITRQSKIELWGWLLLISVSDEICILMLWEKRADEEEREKLEKGYACLWRERMKWCRGAAYIETKRFLIWKTHFIWLWLSEI